MGTLLPIKVIKENMNKVSNNIENGNNNNQAGGNIEIYNNLGPLESFIFKHLENELIPILQKEAMDIKDSIGGQIREIINQQVLNPLKQDLQKENINYHISILREQLKNIKYSKPKENSKHENIERIEIINDWVEGMEKIPQEEEELSRIWEGWYIDFYEGKETSDLQLILNKMKDLSAKEAIFLLNLNDKRKREKNADTLFSFLNLFRPLRLSIRKKQYLHEQLLKKELIERDTTHKRWALLASVVSLYSIIGLFVLSYTISSSFSIWEFLSHTTGLTLIIAAFILWIPYFVLRFRIKYQRTWIGEEIVSYAKKINIHKNNTGKKYD